MKSTQTTRTLRWVLFVGLPLLTSQCKKSNDPVATSGGVQGSWRITTYTISPGVTSDLSGKTYTNFFDLLNELPPALANKAITCLTNSTTTFNANNTLTGTWGANCGLDVDTPFEDNSTWKQEGSKLTVTATGTPEVYEVKVDGNTMTLTQTELQDFGEGDKMYTITLVFIRV